MRRNRQAISVTIDRDVLSAIDDVVAELGDTRSRIIEDCIKSGLEYVLDRGRALQGTHENSMMCWVVQTVDEMASVPQDQRRAVWDRRLDEVRQSGVAGGDQE